MTERELYTLLNASNYEDVLRHFPSRYEDLKETPLIYPYVDYQRYVLKGTISNLRSLGKYKTSIIRFNFTTFSGKMIPCIIINQPFYATILKSNSEKLIVVYYSETRKVFSVSTIINLDSYYAMSEIKPCYNLPRGVTHSYFVSYLKKILTNISLKSAVYSKVPLRYQKKYNLLDEYEAFRIIHFPKNKEELNIGLRVFKYEEALSYSIKSLLLRKESEKRKKQTLPIDKKKVNNFVMTLPYKLTSSQKEAVHDIVLDLEKEKVMYRLLQGDVGSGKTLVAFICLYANYLRNKQGVLLSPTFELAIQHYNNALKVFKDVDINIALLVGNMSLKEKRETLSKLNKGDIDILISTHAALSKDTVFKDLGLTIIDEQQLFGVKQRESLLNKSTTSDLLMMSATPIPRTLSMIINADLDVSTISELPFGDRKVETKVVNSADPIIDKAIKQCLLKNRQVFVVVPKIDENDKDTKSTEEVYNEYVLRYGKENVALLNGRIKKEERDKIFKEFSNAVKKILVSTTVIEVGVDVKDAGLLIVYDANYFGLSSLHQLRGRIGRNGQFALALLIYDKNDKKAKEKLEFLAKNTDGMKISEYDLKMRGTGSYEGEQQSGKSELFVCNFVDDYKVFEASKSDANEILANLDDKENYEYLKWIDTDKKPLLS